MATIYYKNNKYLLLKVNYLIKKVIIQLYKGVSYMAHDNNKKEEMIIVY